jgi:hypothetical protein
MAKEKGNYHEYNEYERCQNSNDPHKHCSLETSHLLSRSLVLRPSAVSFAFRCEFRLPL